MKKSIYCFLSLIAAAAFAACNGNEVVEKPDSTDADVSIEVVSVSSEELSFRLIPNEYVSSYAFGVGSDEDYEKFSSGEDLDYIAENYGTEPVEINRTDLAPNQCYTIFVKAYGEDGLAGAVSSRRIFLADDYFTPVTQFVADHSAAVKFHVTPNCYRFEYYLGTAADRDDFIAGNLDVRVIVEPVDEYTATYMDLESSKEYVMFARAYDRGENQSSLYEIPLNTLPEGECASMTFAVREDDAYKSICEFVPNTKCQVIHAIICEEGARDGMIASDWKGDLAGMLLSWSTIGAEAGLGNFSSYSGETLVAEYTNNSLLLDKPMEYYALLLDADHNPVALHHGKFTTASFKEGAGEASAEISISNINEKGATYTITLNEHAMGVLFDTVDGSWYENAIKSPDYTEAYWQDILLNQGFYWSYGKSEVMFNETTAVPEKKYYVVACPMNVNGPQGWGKMAVGEYTTSKN